MAWPPRFEEDLHPRGHGGKFSKKFKVPDAPDERSKPEAPNPPRPRAPQAPAPAKKAAAAAAPKPGPAKPAKKAPSSARPSRRAARPMNYNPGTAMPRLQATGQPDVPFAAAAPPLPPGQVGQLANPGSGADAFQYTVPIGGTPRATQLAIGRQPDGTMNWDQRGAYVDQKLTYMRENGVDSESLFRLPLTPDQQAHNDRLKAAGIKKGMAVGDWHPDRLRQQEELLDEIWAQRAAHVPNEGRAIFSGGLGGAGKGYALEKVQQVSDRDFFTVNPDDVKELMAKRGMVPMELDPNMTPMELSPVVHEEASELANRLAEKAYAQRKNLVWDITMSSEGSVAEKRVAPMREAGYTEIGALFVDTTVERSVTQARKRWRRGMEEYIDGEGEGGRYLPSKATADNVPSPGSAYRSRNREVFESVKHLFDGHILYQNLDGNMQQLEIAGKGIPKK